MPSTHVRGMAAGPSEEHKALCADTDKRSIVIASEAQVFALDAEGCKRARSRSSEVAHQHRLQVQHKDKRSAGRMGWNERSREVERGRERESVCVCVQTVVQVLTANSNNCS